MARCTNFSTARQKDILARLARHFAQCWLATHYLQGTPSSLRVMYRRKQSVHHRLVRPNQAGSGT